MTLKLKCGCELDFSESYNAIILIKDCEIHKFSTPIRSKLHIEISKINEILNNL